MPRTADAQHILRKMLTTLEAADIVSDHPWAFEKDRWTELVFALLTRIATQPEDSLRVLAYRSRNLGLLDIHTLADEVGKANHSSAANAQRLAELFEEGGFTSDEATRAVNAIREAAMGLQKHHGGRVQNYFRGYAEQMLRELHQ